MAFKRNLSRQSKILRLVEALKAAEVGDTLTHDELGRITGLTPCPNEMFHKALIKANADNGVYFNSIRSVGYIKVHASEWDGVYDKHRDRGRRQFRKGRKFVTNIVNHTNELSDEEQRRASRAVGLLQTVEAMARRIAG